MCGIAGLYHFDGAPVNHRVLERMQGLLLHRGPDDAGILTDGEVGLAHTRLAILDLSPSGHQPLQDTVSGNWIVYNGEIYNFREIRKKLEACGHRFRSNSDTEVLLYAYREWGEACLERFNGMFAFAIFEPLHRRIFLARDRLGIKPLYYYIDHRQFVFASETKALLQVPGVNRRICHEALPEAVAFRYLVGGRTLLKDVRELLPGHLLKVGPRGVETSRYWDVPAEVEAGGDPVRVLDDFEARLARSVRDQLIADVPVGCALSGGVDSSLVTALATDAATSTMKSFTVGFPVDEFDERPHARTVSERLGIENYSTVLGEREFFERLPLLTWHMDEPINHPNSVGIWLLAKLARERVVVLLSGEGGDELLGGYARYRTVLKLRRLRRRLPGIGLAARLLPQSLGGVSGLAARELRRDDDGAVIWSSAYTPSPWLRALFGRGAAERAEVERRAVLERAPRHDRIARHLYYELKTYLVSLLTRVDKMCMAHSLENRVPLLDHEVVEYATGMPRELKYDTQAGKVALTRLAERRFGGAMFERRKVGFGLPSPYFRGQGFEVIREFIASRSFRERGWMDQRAVHRMIARHESGRQDLSAALMYLAALELWARAFVDRAAEASV